MEAVEDGARWQVCGCSSEDAAHAATNILREDNFWIWQTAGPEEDAWIEVEARSPTALRSIEVVNAGSSLIEVFALSEEASARIDAQRGAGKGMGKEMRTESRDGDGNGDGEDGAEVEELADYEVVMTAKQVMSNKDLAAKSNRDRCMLFEPPKLSEATLRSRWRRLRIVCKQPYGGPEDKAPIGLARLKVTACSPPSPTGVEAEKSTERVLPSPHSRGRLGKDPSPPLWKIPPSPPQVDTQGGPPSGSGKRKLPGWAAGNGVDGAKDRQHKGGGEEEGGCEKRSVSEDGGGVSSAGQAEGILARVVFAISGIENPERGALREQAVELGAEYRRGWEEGCTLLLCAFPNTPKFREVKQDGGTIVSHKWVQECYRQKRVLPMAPFLMWEGRPWRKEQGKGKGREEGAADGGLGRLPYSDGQVALWVQSDIKAVERYLREQEDGPDDESLVVATAGGMTACFQDCLASLTRASTLAAALEEWPEETVPTALAKLREWEGRWSREAVRGEVERVRGVYAQALDLYMKQDAERQEVGGDSDATELLGAEDGGNG